MVWVLDTRIYVPGILHVTWIAMAAFVVFHVVALTPTSFLIDIDNHPVVMPNG